jgi:hypothetical protein
MQSVEFGKVLDILFVVDSYRQSIFPHLVSTAKVPVFVLPVQLSEPVLPVLSLWLWCSPPKVASQGPQAQNSSKWVGHGQFKNFIKHYYVFGSESHYRSPLSLTVSNFSNLP